MPLSMVAYPLSGSNEASLALAVGLLIVALLLLLVEIKYYTHMISGLLGTVLFAVGATFLLESVWHISPVWAIAASSALGVLTISLGLLGMRARGSPHLLGPNQLVGRMGVARTTIQPEENSPTGTVFIEGEYWQAFSRLPIAPGERVRVERVHGLLVYVEEA